MRCERLERRELGRRARAGNVERSIRPARTALEVDELVAFDDRRGEGRDLAGVAVVGREHDSAAGDRDARIGERVAAGVDGLLAVADEGEAVGAVMERVSESTPGRRIYRSVPTPNAEAVRLRLFRRSADSFLRRADLTVQLSMASIPMAPSTMNPVIIAVAVNERSHS